MQLNAAGQAPTAEYAGTLQSNMRCGAGMSYRTILLSLNDEERALELIRAALALAVDEKAHIVGLYAIPSALPPPELIGPVANTWIEEQMRVFRDQARR